MGNLGFTLNSLVLATSNVNDRIFGLDAQMLGAALFVIVNVLLLITLLSYLLYLPVKKFMADRSNKIETNIRESATNRENAEALKADYEAKLKNINKEADEILAEARKKAIVREDEIIREAKAEAERIMHRAHLEIEREKEQAKDDMRKEIIEVATLMASKFVANSMDVKTKDALIEETLNDMGDSTWLN